MLFFKVFGGKEIILFLGTIRNLRGIVRDLILGVHVVSRRLNASWL